MFTTEQIPDQTGRTIIITGANSGLGKVSSLELARKGALPQLYAATALDVHGGDFYGPSGMQEMRGGGDEGSCV